MSSYYDRQGKPMTLAEWAKASEGERHIGQDRVGDAEVSTVWMGLDHQFVVGGPLLIFETMIFGGDYDEFQWRYSTEEEAAAGHLVVVRDLRKGRKLSP